MTINLHAVTIWVGIAGSAAGIGFPVYSTHKQDQADLAAQRQADVQRAVKEQAEHDRLWRTLDEYKRHLALLDENLPAQERRIARSMFAQLQVQQDTQVIYDKEMPEIKSHRMTELPPVAADTPEENQPKE